MRNDRGLKHYPERSEYGDDKELSLPTIRDRRERLTVHELELSTERGATKAYYRIPR